jgi:hypothetical protein
LFSIR